MKQLVYILSLFFMLGCTSDNTSDNNTDPTDDTTGGETDPTDDGQGQTDTVLLRYTHTTLNEFPEPEDLIFEFNENGSLKRFKFELNNGSSTGYDEYVSM